MRILGVAGQSPTSTSDSFTTMQPITGTSPVATSPNDTLTFISSDGSISIEGNSGTDTLDFTVLSGGSGITRLISSISSNQTLGSTASIDYVYFVSGTTTVTMPTAVGNENRYTVKNTGSNTVTIIFTGGQNADGSTSLALTPNTSLDLISDNSNYFIV